MGVAPRLDRALRSLERWRERGVHFAPIRHHSPGCARALIDLLDAVRPATVLIEGPREFTALLPALSDDRCRPPVAVLSIATGASAFYPLAEYSPEWIAVRWGAATGAVIDFIDQSWADRPPGDDDGSLMRTLQREQHLARSASLTALAERLGCRDHDELWEHLFELRDADWRSYFTEVFAWCALSRLDYDRAMLDADGSHAREGVMAAILARHRQVERGPLVVVTGGFHTIALLEALDDAPEAAWLTRPDPAQLDVQRDAWLIRYDFDRLDGLRGYGAGMPSPGFWQRVWESGPDGDPRSLVAGVLLDVATELRGHGAQLSSADVLVAAEQALRLMELRGRSAPGRTDVLDAMESCFVRDDSVFLGAESDGALGRAVARVFGGQQLGDLPPGLAAPPLVTQVREAMRAARFIVHDSERRRVRLDTVRRPQHVRRRELLARMRFIGSGFAGQVGGADLLAGYGLGQVFEEWEYAWTPAVEAALIESSVHGATLAEVVAHRVASRLMRPGDAADAAALLTELVVIGATEHIPAAVRQLGARMGEISSLAETVSVMNRLHGLLTSRDRYPLGPHDDELHRLLDAGLAAAALHLQTVSAMRGDELDAVCTTILVLSDLLRRLDDGSRAVGVPRRELSRLRRTPADPRLHGLLTGIAHADGEISSAQLTEAIAAFLHPGVEPEALAGFLLGLLQAAPELAGHSSELIETMNARLAEFDDEAFLRVLPDLRRAFTWLRPTETARVAQAVASLIGGDASDLDAVLAVDPHRMIEARNLEYELVRSLARDGLWREGRGGD